MTEGAVPGRALPHVVVLGGGPAGVGAAQQLARRGLARVTLLEQNSYVGGHAGSFELAGQRVDFGSHRLHPACDRAVLADIRAMLGDELLDRPRHGRIRLRGRWIHFPLKPLDLLLRLDPAFAVDTVCDLARRRARDGVGDAASFASELRATLGPTICEEFYFPYARKIWGREPTELSATQARRRVSANSIAKLLRKVAAQIPGLKPPGAGRFFYPRRGFGAISEAYAADARAAGAELLLGWRVAELCPEEHGWTVRAEHDGESRMVHANYLWSTLPITLLARLVAWPLPDAVREAMESLEYRAMLLVYLTLDVDRFTEFDAHYFPEQAIAITRLSEPKNYAALAEPRHRTTLCAELPCAPDDERWCMSDDALGDLVAADLARAGIPLPICPAAVHVRRLRHAYPIYTRGYERAFEALDRWAGTLPRALSFGRQGLFAHDNTHHALRMAYAAANCLGESGFDTGRWAEYRREFETHVVED